MMQNEAPIADTTRTRDLPSAALWPFFGLTFGISWGLFILMVVAQDTIERLTGPLSGHHPLFMLAVWAPAISALCLVLWRGGRAGLRRFASRLVLFRAPPVWYAMLLAGIPALFYAGALAKGAPLWPGFENAATFVGLLAFMAILGPVEELGWRGVALPILQRHLTPVVASLVLGAVWGLWHLPAFLLSGTVQSQWQFLPFLIGAMALSVIVTPLFNAARGSILLPMLFHWQLNNPAWPDAQPFDTWFFVAAAVAAVFLNRDAMLSGSGAVTSVIPRTDENGRNAESL